MRAVMLAAVLMLAACGADGPPLRPAAPPETGSGITVTGEVAFGLSTRGN